MSADKVTNIGGYEFHIVKEGLDVAEVTDFVEKSLAEVGGANGEHQSLFPLQDFAKKMEVLAAEAEQVAGQVKQETIRQAQAEEARLLAEAEQRARELMAETETAAAAIRKEAAEEEQRARKLMAETETAAAAIRKEAAEEEQRARELMAETERAGTAMRRQAQELLQMAKSKAEQVIARTPHLMEHGIRVATDRMYQELVSMVDVLEAEVKASPGWQGQSAEEAFEEPEEAVAMPATAEGEAEAQPGATRLEDKGRPKAEAQPEATRLEDKGRPKAEAQPEATRLEDKGRPKAEAQPEATRLEDKGPILYQGQVLLSVTPEASGGLELQRLRYRLPAFPGVNIVGEFGDIEGGRTLVLHIEKPFPLIQRLIEMSDVASAKDARLSESFLAPFMRKSKALESAPVIRLRLKNASSNPLR